MGGAEVRVKVRAMVKVRVRVKMTVRGVVLDSDCTTDAHTIPHRWVGRSGF